MENLIKNFNTNITNFIFVIYIFFWSQSIISIDVRYLLISLIPLYFFTHGYKNFEIKKRELFILIFLNLFVFSHYFLNNLFLNENFYSNINALLGFFLISVISLLFKDYLIKNLEFIIKQFVVIFFIYFLIETIYFKETYSINNFDCLNGWINVKNVAFTRFNTELYNNINLFFESSHFGMMAPAAIIFLLLKNNNSFKEKFLNYLMVIFLFLFISTTFLVGLIMSSLIILLISFKKIRNNEKLPLIFVVLFSLIVLISNKQCNMRVTETIGMSLINLKSFFYEDNKINDKYIKTREHETINVSSEVFNNSFIVSVRSFISNPLGLGLNNYEKAHKRYSEKFISDSHFLNQKDASNNLVKIVVEFGLFSLLFFFFLVKFSLRSSMDLPNKGFFISIAITQLIRGAGYFNGGFLLCILIIFLYSLNNENI